MIIILTALYGTLISRLHGGGFVQDVPKWIRNTLWALPFGYAAYLATPTLWGLSVFFTVALCYAGKTTGHGNFIDLGSMPEGEDEGLEFIIKPLKDRLPRYWYDVLGLSLTGFAAVSGLVIVMLFVDPLFALALALSGLMKPMGYIAGKFMHKEYTVIGELGAGFFAFLALGVYLETIM